MNFKMIPRRGIWNLRDCRHWFKRGCPKSCFYIAYPDGMMRITRYIPGLDMLYLERDKK